MHLLQSPPTLTLTLTPRYPSFRNNITSLSSHKPYKLITKSTLVSSCSSSQTPLLPSNEQELLEFITNSEGEGGKKRSLPGVRTYENEFGRLSLIGDVGFNQAVVAAAADGGGFAEEHIVAGAAAMVIETVFPGPSDEHSTVSTRLFLPAQNVKEKAKKLRNSLSGDIHSSTASGNILSMTFRQVVLRRIWSFELVLFSPGAKRNMGDLENQREDEALFTLSSSDERVISVLAEAVCMCVLESTERDICENSLGTTSNFFSHWFQKPKTTASKDLSVSIHKISDDQIIENAKKYLATFNRKENYGSRKMTKKNQWWTPSTYSKLEKIGGSEFGTWTNKFVLAYRLQVDADKLENLKCEGWKKSAENRWEALLTHSQMVGLAGILDMFYEDRYTLPADKILSSGVVADFTNVSTNKKGSSVWKLISITIASGLLMGFISIIAQLPWTRLNKVERSLTEHCSVSLSETHSYKQSMETTELEGLCIMIVKKIKDAVGWPGDITTEINVGAWTGELPSYLRRLDTGDIVQEVVTSNEKDAGSYSNGNVPMSAGFFTSVVSASDISNTNVKTSVQDIASYQVVLSKEGHIIGFQPTSRVAVNHWANNPLAKELYKGRKLSPGLLEPGLKIPHPDKIVLIELLMSVNPDSWFALARPVL